MLVFSCILFVFGSGSFDVVGMLNSIKGRGLVDGCSICFMLFRFLVEI